MKKINYVILFLLFLLWGCQKTKEIYYVQNQNLKATIKVETDSLRTLIGNQEYQDAARLGEIFLQTHKDSLNNDSIGWALLHHRLGVAYSRIEPQKDSFYSKMQYHFTNSQILRERISSEKIELLNTQLNYAIGKKNYAKYTEASILFLQTYKSYSSFDKQDILRILSSLHGLIECHIENREIDLVGKYFIEADKVFKNTQTPSDLATLEFLDILKILAYDFSQKNNNIVAIDKFEEAKFLAQKINIGQEEIIKITNPIAFCKIRLGKTNEAISDLENVISVFTTQQISDSTELAKAYSYLGDCYKAKQNNTKATYYYEKLALPIFIKNNNKEALGICYKSLADAYLSTKDYQKAFDNYQKAIQSETPFFNPKTDTENPNEKSLQSCPIKPNLAETMLAKAEALSAFAKQTKSSTYLDAALQTYQTLNTLQGMNRSEITTEQSKIRIGQKQEWVADALVIAKKLGQQNNSKFYDEAAYMMLQQVKSQVINEHLQGEKGKILANVSAEEQAKERALLAKAAQARKALLDTPNDAQLQKKCLEVEQDFYSFQADLAKKYPTYAEVKYNHKALSIKEIQINLTNDMAVLDYLTTKDSLHIFCITKQGLTWKTIPISARDIENVTTIQDILNQAIDKIETPESADFLSCSHALYRCLIEPIASELSGIKRLRISADGWVHRVGFESLCTKAYLGNWGDKKIPYMIRDFAISYLFSVKELAKLPTNVSSGRVSVGSFGISYNDNTIFQRNRSADSCLQTLAGTRGNGKLNFAIKEAQNVKALWGNGDCILDKEATKEKFVNLCKSNNYSVLHLALHGIPQCDNPENIQLVFSKDSSNHDNMMHMAEIAGMRMNSDLAVLSACHSGEGELADYEGVLSLGRAFAMAGCKSLITSNGYVIDESSPIIFDYFYNYLKNNNLEKDLALQAAICDYLNKKDNTARIPYHWANFRLMGDVAAIKGEPIFYWKWLVALSILAILGIGLYKKYK